MALLFPWATKEYLLWEMSLGQIITYFNIGTDIRYGTGAKPGIPKKLADMSPEEVNKKREELRKLYGAID